MLLNNDLDKNNKNASKNIHSIQKSSPYKIYYDFYEDAWIGYLPSLVINHSEAPHSTMEDTSSSDLKTKISEALDLFKEKGVKQIETDFQISNDFLNSTLEYYSFEYVDSERLVSRLPLNEIKLSAQLSNPEYLTSQMKALGLHSEPSFLNDKLSELEEGVINFLTDKENISKESLRSFFSYLKKNPDKIVSQITLMDKDSILGYTMIVRTRWSSNTGILSFLDIVNADANMLKDLILAQSVSDCKKNGIDLLEVHIRDDVLEKENTYLPYGFEFKNLHRYQLND